MAVITFRQLRFSSTSCLRPGGSQRVKLSPPPAFQFAPLPLDPPPGRQAMQGGKQRTGTHHKDPSGHLLDPVCDPDSVERLKFQCAQDQEIQRALQEFRGFSHVAIISTLDIECQW